MSLTADQVHGIPYQLIHRTASACSLDRPTRWIIYQLFGSGAVDHYVDDMVALQRFIGPSEAIKWAVMACPLSSSDRHAALVGRWERGERALAAEVRACLTSVPAFSFEQPHWISVVR